LGWNVCLQLSSIPFFLQVLFKIKQSDFKLILIAPAWPKQAWIPELQHLKKKRNGGKL
jgi:hypothetical protein